MTSNPKDIQFGVIFLTAFFVVFFALRAYAASTAQEKKNEQDRKSIEMEVKKAERAKQIAQILRERVK